MAFDDLTKVTVTGHAVTLDGVAATGKVTFTPTVTLLQDTVSGQAIFPVMLTVPFTAGAISIDLPTTNHPAISPIGWGYDVAVIVTGSTQETFRLSVPYTSSSFDLFKAAPVPGSGVVWVPPAPASSGDVWGFWLLMRGRG